MFIHMYLKKGTDPNTNTQYLAFPKKDKKSPLVAGALKRNEFWPIRSYGACRFGCGVRGALQYHLGTGKERG
jgi:hypothetical protein